MSLILISRYADVEGVKQGTASFEFIRKPFVPEAILMAVKKVVGSVDANASQTPIPDAGRKPTLPDAS